MADNSIAVLNVGSQSISLGVFENSKKGLSLSKFATTSVLADPANEVVRLAQVKVATENLIEKLGISKSKIRYSISGSSVFTRFVKLPALGDNDLEQLVTFEAQQHIPFPINEVAWDWQLMDNNEVEQEVAIVAIKKDLLNEVNTAVADAGLEPVHVESAAVSLANAFFHTYPDSQESTLIVDAGAKATNLIYIEGKQVFIRSVNVCGVSLTSAISKEYQVEFAEAERFKTEAGRIALNGTYLQQWDEGTAALATIISNAISRLPSEISRTTNFFRSQHSGSAPTKVLLAGAGASLPYFKEFIEEKLKLPTEYFNPLARIALGGSVDQTQIASQAHTLGEVVGLALSGSGKSVFDIDLVPDSLADKREETRKRPYYAAAVAALAVGSLIWAGAQHYFASVSADKLAEISQKVKSLEPFERKLTALDKSRKSLDLRGNEYAAMIEGRSRSLSLLEELRGYLSKEGIYLQSIEELVGYTFPIIDDELDDKSSLVADDTSSITYGSSALTAAADTPGATPPVINAIKIKGYWLDNHSEAYTILNTIKDAPDTSFTFEYKGKPLDDNQLLQANTTILDGEIKAPFTMFLPLSEASTPLN